MPKKQGLLSFLTIVFIFVTQSAWASALSIFPLGESAHQTIINGHSTAVDFYYQLRNNLSVPLYLDSQAWSNSQQLPVSLDGGSCEFGQGATPIAANGQCVLVYRYTPSQISGLTHAVTYHSTISLRDAVPEVIKANASLTIEPLLGELQVVPAMVDTTVNKTGNVTITNSGKADITNLVVSIPSSLSGVFTNNCGSTLTENQSCTLSFNTSGLSSDVNNVPITMSAESEGEVLNDTVPVTITVNSGHLAFSTSNETTQQAVADNQEVNSILLQAGSQGSITLSNVGNQAVSNLQVQIPASLSAYMNSQCSGSLAADASCSLSYSLPSTLSAPIQADVSASANNANNSPKGLPTDVLDQWQSVSENLTGGRVRTFITFNNALYVGLQGGGVYKLDSSNQWKSIDLPGLSNPDVYAFAELGSTLYAGTTGGGVFKLVNNQWQAVDANGLTNQNVRTLAVVGGTLYAGTLGGGVFALVNNVWVDVSPNLADKLVRSLTVIGNTLYAATGAGVYQYTGNDNWIPVATDSLSQRVNALAHVGNVLYAGTYTQGVYRLDTSGDNPEWTPVDPDGLTNKEILCFTVTSSNVLYTGTDGRGVFRLGGNNQWSNIGDEQLGKLDVYGLYASGSSVYAATDGLGGVFALHNDQWDLLTDGLDAVDVMAQTTFQGHMYLATLTNGVFKRDTQGQWQPVREGLPDDAQVYLFKQFGADLYIGTDYGVYVLDADNVWQPVGSDGLLNQKNVVVNGLVVLHGVLYAGTRASDKANSRGLFQLTNGRWIRTSLSSVTLADNVSALQGYDNTLYVALYDEGVVRMNEQTQQWELVNTGFGVDIPAVSSFVVNGSTLYIGTFDNGVFKLGRNDVWVSVDPQALAESQYVSALFAYNGKIYMGTYNPNNVYELNANQQWQSINAGLVIKLARAFSVFNGKLYAGTAGNGIYSMNISS